MQSGLSCPYSQTILGLLIHSTTLLSTGLSRVGSIQASGSAHRPLPGVYSKLKTLKIRGAVG